MENPVNKIIDLIREKELTLRKLKRTIREQEKHNKHNLNWVHYHQAKLRAIKLEEDIAKLKEEKNNYKRVTLKELLPKDEIVRHNIHKQLVAISLAADYLLHESLTFKETLDKLGIRSSDIDDEVKHLCNLAQKTASRMVGTKAVQLEQVLIDNEELLNSLHDKTLDYINKTLELG